MTGLQGVMFDMDGLLVDTEPLWFAVEAGVMARLGGSWGPQDQAKLVGGSLAASVDYLLSKATRPVPPEQVGRWMLDGMIEEIRGAQVALRPGAAGLLAEVAASGVPYALVTSSERSVMDAVLSGTGLAFPVTVCAADVSRIKPDPEPYLLGAKLLGADPGACVVLEDSLNGVAAAEAAGCLLVAVPCLTPVPAAGGRVVKDSLADVSLDFLRELARAR